MTPVTWPDAGATTVPPAPAGWTTTFSDAFSGAAGSGADGSWTYDQGTQYTGAGCAANWGTGEVERNTNATANVSEDGSGHLNGGWSTWKTVPSSISSVTGTHDVYLEFSSGAAGNPPFVSLHWFSFPAH